MIYNVNSIYPGKADPLIMLHDLDLHRVRIMDEYHEDIKEGMYEEAYAHLSGRPHINAYVADLYNMLVNRVEVTQHYLLNKEHFNKNYSLVSSLSDGVAQEQNGVVICISNEVIE